MRAILTFIILLCLVASVQAQDSKETRSSPITIGEINFASGSVQFLPQRHNEIKRIASAITAFINYYGNVIVVIEGHTDSRGGNTYNLNMGESRAAVVRGTLTKEGIPLKWMRISTHGENKPRASNRTSIGRAKNRRVVVYLIK